jgi:uncharacterized protein (TIRG00374 family)
LKKTSNEKGIILKSLRKLIYSRFFLGLLIAVVLINSLLYNVNFGQLKSMLSSWNLIYFSLATFCALAAILMRGYRWGLIVDQLGKRDYVLAMHMTHVGLMLNAVLPLRTGDFYKVIFVGRSGTLSYHKAVVALIFERVLDILVLYSFYLFGLFMLGKPNSAPVDLFGENIPKNLITNAFDSLAVAIASVLMIFIFLQSRVAKKILIDVYRNGSGLFHSSLRKFYMTQKSFAEAVRLIRSPFHLAFIFILSLLPWLLFALSIHIVSYGIQGAQLDFIHAIFVASVALLSVQLPSVPGGWGLFEAGGVFAIISYSNLDISIAFSVVLMAHLCQYIPTIVVGLCSQLSLLFKPQSQR